MISAGILSTVEDLMLAVLIFTQPYSALIARTISRGKLFHILIELERNYNLAI